MGAPVSGCRSFAKSSKDACVLIDQSIIFSPRHTKKAAIDEPINARVAFIVPSIWWYGRGDDASPHEIRFLRSRDAIPHSSQRLSSKVLHHLLGGLDHA